MIYDKKIIKYLTRLMNFEFTFIKATTFAKGLELGNIMLLMSTYRLNWKNKSITKSKNANNKTEFKNMPNKLKDITEKIKD